METTDFVGPEMASLDQSYLAELIRAEVSRSYSMACATLDTGFSCHRNRIQSAVRSRLGSGLACPVTQDSLRETFDALVEIGDLAHVASGNYVPREPRLTMFCESWGRVSGGVPLECCTYSGIGIKDHLENTPSIGRMVNLMPGVQENAPDDWEVAATFFWSEADDQKLYDHLLATSLQGRCPELGEPCVFYDGGRTGRSRRERWINRLPVTTSFVVARETGTSPSYFVILMEPSGSVWREVSHEDARKWILLSERVGKSKNFLRTLVSPDSFLLFLPDMLPEFANAALFSAAHQIRQTEKGWELSIFTPLRDFTTKILKVCNCVIQ